jgi:phosphoglycerol transferase MdoB-like AlkP superfamily enzyme
MTLPRLVVFIGSDNVWSPLTLMSFLVGFIKDGLVVLPFIILIQSTHRQLIGVSSTITTTGALLGQLGAACLLSLMMLNAEVFNQTKTPLGLEYFQLLSSTETGPLLFINDRKSVFILILDFLIIPASYLIFSKLLTIPSIELSMRTISARIACGFLLVFSLLFNASASLANSKLHSEDNYLIYFIKDLMNTDEYETDYPVTLADILDSLPLKNGGMNEPDWHFFDKTYPLVKATDYHLCRLGILTGAVCEKDADGDGFAVKIDCNDVDPKINTNGVDIPGNGIDEDCSGIDANPPNIIYIHWEGARAVNVGSIGYGTPSTPRFDELSKEGLLFTNAYANGAQTRFCLVPMYCSTFDRLSHKWISQSNPQLNLLSFPSILRSRGFQTIYVHGGDNNFGSHNNRLQDWFEDIYDKKSAPFNKGKFFNWGLKDKELFEMTYQLLKERQDKRPFFMAIATLSLHYPMGLPDPEYEFSPHKGYTNQLTNILRYADDALADFIQRVRQDKQFENTVFIVAADHGINGSVPTVLTEEVVWIPLLLIGEKWNIKPAKINELRQQADIGPTILDRLGIETPNPFIGHSLLRRFGTRSPKVFFHTANGGEKVGMRELNYKYWGRLNGKSDHLYDLSQDPKEKRNLSKEGKYRELDERLFQTASSVFRQNNKLIKENRIWNKKFWLDK